MIIMKQGEPKAWFYMDDKYRMHQKEEEWLKYKVIKEYFRDQTQSLNDIQNVIAAENEMYSHTIFNQQDK